MAKYAAAIDQGTTSTRFMVFDHGGKVVSVDQKEHEQIFPKPGWVEHDALEIWQRTQEVVKAGLDKIAISDLAAVGITNQRETTLVWDRGTGKPVYNAIVWQDTRTDKIVEQLSATAARTASAPRSGCHWRPISRDPRSSGSWTTSMARAPRRRPATSPSATSTHG